jgi:hypothetical protein
MKERPILFSAAMVRALLAGTKTQTRRVVKPQPAKSSGTHRGYPLELMANDWAWPHPRTSGATTISNRPNGPLGWEIHCPYGQPGDRLWVRERFTPLPMQAPTENPSRWQILYAAGGAEEREAPAGYNPMLYNYERWSPSIHMPHWASRLTLEITGVRVERLQDISEEDAQAEGIERVGGEFSCTPWRNYRIGCPDEMRSHCSARSRSYMTLWESINGPGSWDANPWVWVIEFKRVEQA